MASKKFPTNETKIAALIKNLDTLDMAILHERLLIISKMTRQAIEQDATAFEGIMWNPQMFIKLCDKIDKHLAF